VNVGEGLTGGRLKIGARPVRDATAEMLAQLSGLGTALANNPVIEYDGLPPDGKLINGKHSQPRAPLDICYNVEW